MSWILTHTGVHFDLLAPQPEMIRATDIMVALARQARFNGHTGSFYSVAQHSVLVSQYTESPLGGLLHDAAEAYVGDLVRPLKELLPLFDSIELRIQRAIEERFGLNAGSLACEDVKYWDAVLLATERDRLMIASPHAWSHLPAALDLPISPLHALEAGVLFGGRFQELVGHCPKRFDTLHHETLALQGATDLVLACERL